jgi:hypothetical protein
MLVPKEGGQFSYGTMSLAKSTCVHMFEGHLIGQRHCNKQIAPCRIMIQSAFIDKPCHLWIQKLGKLLFL